MKLSSSCKEAIDSCLATRSFAVAHLYNDEKPMKIHIHDCYEIYFSISGGKQFLIDNRFYDFKPGDIFFINQYESHYLSQIDNVTHERIILSIHPDYLKQLSTVFTDLDYCFSCRSTGFGHQLSLSSEEQKRFLYYIHRFSESAPFGQDLLDQAYLRRLEVEYAWHIAVFGGGIAYMIIMAAGGIFLEATIPVVPLVAGTMVSVFVGEILEFFFFHVDYKRTERLQFEDDEYYYYVKAVPKIKDMKKSSGRKPEEVPVDSAVIRNRERE